MTQPCDAFADQDAFDECCSEPLADASAQLALASRVLWMATGQRYGTCEVVARPCCCSPCRKCGCATMHALDLSQLGYVDTVTTVTVDGAEVFNWRFDEHRWLVNTDGEQWPSCQDLLSAATEVDTFAVTLELGEPVPATIVSATAELACEIVKGCNGDGDCQLPSRIQNLIRQGVSMTFLDPQEFLVGSPPRTGVYGVDLAIAMENPAGLQRAPEVVSPQTKRCFIIPGQDAPPAP